MQKLKRGVENVNNKSHKILFNKYLYYAYKT